MFTCRNTIFYFIMRSRDGPFARLHIIFQKKMLRSRNKGFIMLQLWIIKKRTLSFKRTTLILVKGTFIFQICNSLLNCLMQPTHSKSNYKLTVHLWGLTFQNADKENFVFQRKKFQKAGFAALGIFRKMDTVKANILRSMRCES